MFLCNLKLSAQFQYETNSLPISLSYTSDISFINANTGYITGYTSNQSPKIFKTINKGANWILTKDFGNILNPYLPGYPAISFINANTGWVIFSYFLQSEMFTDYSDIQKTTDGGVTWQLVLRRTFPQQDRIGGLIKFVDENNGYLIEKWSKNFMKTTNGGNNWTTIKNIPGSGYDFYCFTISPTNSSIIYLGGTKYGTQGDNSPLFYVSNNAGASFQTICDGSSQNGMKGIRNITIINNNNNNDLVRLASNSQLFKYNDNPQNPFTQISTLPNDFSYLTFSDYEKGFGFPFNNVNNVIYRTENHGLNWTSESLPVYTYASSGNPFAQFGNILYVNGIPNVTRKLGMNLSVLYDNVNSSGSFSFDGANKDIPSSPTTHYLRGGNSILNAASILSENQIDEKIFYSWNFGSMNNYISNYYFDNVGDIKASYKTKLKADNLWAINNASGSKSVRDKNGNINTLHESIGGIFFTKSYNNGSDFKTEEIVNDNKSNNNQFSVSNNTNPLLNEIKKEISIVHNLSPERNMIAVWENRNGSTITINTATREKTIDLQKYYWKRDEDNTFNITSNIQSFFSHPKVFSQVMGISAGFIDTTYYQMKIITYLEPGTNGTDLKAKVQYKNGSVTKNQTYTIVAGADFTDFACVSDIYKTISGTVLGFNLHYSYKKNGNVFYKKETIYYNYYDLVKESLNEENVSSFDLYYQKSNPDITLRNGAPAISYTGRYQENRNIEWDNGGSGPSTLSTTYYPVVVKYKKYGVTGWTKIVYNSNGFGTQENANVEGSKDTSAYIVNYSKNGTLFNQFVQIDGRRGYRCSPGAFNGSDAKLVRGGYKGQFGSGSNPLLLKLNYPENSRYTIMHTQFSILPAAIETDGFSNLDGVIEKDNTLYSLTLGPIIASNTTYGFEDDTPPQTVQNAVEFNETMVSAVFSLSNNDTLILGAHGKYATSFGQAMQPLKYHVNLVNSTTNQIHRELFRDTIYVEDSVGIEFLRGYIINGISNGTEQFYVQMIVDTVDAGDGDFMLAGVYSDDTPPEGDAPINYKTKVFFENSSNSLTPGNQIPKEYSLSQNYPNPFNPSTTIKYSLPKDGFVSLKIYDITGREVKSLAGEVKKAGYYSVTFNASSLASGVYFYRIQSNDFVQTKRMVLIK